MKTNVNMKAKVAVALTNAFLCSSAFAWVAVVPSQSSKDTATCIAPLKETANQAQLNPNAICAIKIGENKPVVKKNIKILKDGCDLRLEVTSPSGNRFFLYPDSIERSLASNMGKPNERVVLHVALPFEGVNQSASFVIESSERGVTPLSVGLAPTAANYAANFQVPGWRNERQIVSAVLGKALNEATFPMDFYNNKEIAALIEKGGNLTEKYGYTQDNVPSHGRFGNFRNLLREILQRSFDKVELQERCPDSDAK